MDSHPGKTALELAKELSAELAEFGPTESSRRTKSLPAPGDAADAPALYDRLVNDPELVAATRDLFANRHYAQSVEQAFKYVNNLVKSRTGLAFDGADLMNRAFSVGAPSLKLSGLKTQSQKDQQIGYMLMLAGAMTGIRNPRAHEHSHLDDPGVALELLGFANHLARTVRAASRARKRRSK